MSGSAARFDSVVKASNASEGGTFLPPSVEADLARRCAIVNIGRELWDDMTRWERSNEIAVALHNIRVGLAAIQADAKLQSVA